jgi:hypothetical protein
VNESVELADTLNNMVYAVLGVVGTSYRIASI